MYLEIEQTVRVDYLPRLNESRWGRHVAYCNFNKDVKEAVHPILSIMNL